MPGRYQGLPPSCCSCAFRLMLQVTTGSIAQAGALPGPAADHLSHTRPGSAHAVRFRIPAHLPCRRAAGCCLVCCWFLHSWKDCLACALTTSVTAGSTTLGWQAIASLKGLTYQHQSAQNDPVIRSATSAAQWSVS